MPIRVCVAGVSGWTGSEVARAILHADEFELTGAIARRNAGRDAKRCRRPVIHARNHDA